MKLKEILKSAELYSAQYDYDRAIEILTSEERFTNNPEIIKAADDCRKKKESCIRQEIKDIPHIFFHTLIYDTKLAFDGDFKAKGYNQFMTTCNEFKEICVQMYERGFVLVSLHDMACEETDPETGETVMKEGNIYLPKGKKAVVLSQDDLCYYEYMKGDGMATRLIADKNGRIRNEYTLADGSISIVSCDMVPLLDDFIEVHPDFSYHGHKAALAFTGYNGILGYRTDETYDPKSELYDETMTDAPNHNLAADRKEAVNVIKALVDDGYEMAAHSWGHNNYGDINPDALVRDAKRWDKNVNSLILEATGKPCDILIYPFGDDIGYWNEYGLENGKEGCLEKFNFLYNIGFRYYCNVDINQPWVQLSDRYMRHGRINIDGIRMWHDIQNPSEAKLSDFIDVPSVFDSARPTPVPEY